MLFSQADTTKQQIEVESDRLEVLTNTNPPQTSYQGNVVAYHKGAFIYCDNAILKRNDLYAYGNVAIIQHDTIKMYCDTLIYKGDSSVAYLIDRVILINTEDTLYTSELTYYMDTKWASYVDRALIQNGNNKLKSEVGRYNLDTKESFFYNKVTMYSDSVAVATDTMQYNTGTGQATWFSPTLITKGKAKLYSRQGEYNNQTKLGVFIGDAQYLEDTALATADTIFYNGDKDIIKLNSNAFYQSNTDTARGNNIFFDRKNDFIRIEGDGVYNSTTTRAKGDTIVYDKPKDDIKIQGKGFVVDGATIISGDDITYNKLEKSGKIIGNVYYQDTSEHRTIQSDTLDYDQSTSYIRATSQAGKKPVFTSEIDDDTLHIAALVLVSYEVITPRKTKVDTASKDSSVIDTLMPRLNPKDTAIVLIDSSTIEYDTITYISADGDVVLFKKDMQSHSDSLFFNGQDSLFTLYYNPVIWQDSTQMTADTITIQLKDKKVKTLNLIQNTLIINTIDFILFNQIQGKTGVGQFEDGKLKTLNINGNAQVLYYMIDDADDSYIGVNQTECSYMNFYFGDKNIEDIRFYESPKSKILPIEGTDHEAIKLKGFNDRFKERPLSIEGLDIHIVIK